MSVIELIPAKESGLITAKKLSELSGKKESYIRREINKARTAGIPVCSTQRGYYISYDNADILDTIQFLQRRVQTQLKAINGLVTRVGK